MLSRKVTTSYLRVRSLSSDPSPNQPPLVTPRKVVVLPSGVTLVILTRPSMTPIQCSTGSPLRQAGTPTGSVRTCVSASMRGNQPAIREKYLGIWQSSTWSQTRDEVEWLACGLAQKGLARGAHIAVI